MGAPMMRIPFTSTTADRIEAAHKALVAVEMNIGKLERERIDALADSDDPDRIRDIDHHIADEHRTAQATRDRIHVLDARLLVEAAAARQQVYAESVRAIDATMESLERAGASVEAAAQQLSAASKLYTDAVQNILDRWPADVPKSGISHFVGTHRLGNLIRDAFAPNALVRSISHQAPSPEDFVYRATKAAASIEGFAATEARNRSALIEELRSRGTPPAEPADDVVEVEAA
jgi:hypothetical protein